MRADAARAGAVQKIQSLVDELSSFSPEFKRTWRENDVRTHGDGAKVLNHPIAGELKMDYSAFAVDGRPDLSLVIYNPATKEDSAKIKELVRTQSKARKPA